MLRLDDEPRGSRGWGKNLAQGLSREKRRELVDWESRELPVSTQAALLSLNRSSLSYQCEPPSPHEVACKHRIDEIYTAHPYYGYRRIAAQLHRHGLLINPKTVAHYMREMELAAIYPGPNLSKRTHQAGIYPYLLSNIKATTPNHIWVLISRIFAYELGGCTRVSILDWYSRYVVSWELDQSMQISFVIEAVQRALAQAVPQICNSDQGSQFTSPQYTQLLISHDVRISMDSKGRALDNVFTERLWRSIKYEEVYVKEYVSPCDARDGLTNYLRFYNEERLHQALDYGTPAEVYFTKEAKR